MSTALIIFIVCTLANVILSTIKSIATIKGGKFNAAFWSAASFGLYTYIVVLTANSPISTFAKVIITIGCNLVGVYIVKLIENFKQKNKLWKVEMTIKKANAENMQEKLNAVNVSNNYLLAGEYAIFNCYCKNPDETTLALLIGKEFNAKAFASANLLI